MTTDIQEREAVAIMPPSNVEAEQALLAAILVNNAAFHRVSDTLRSEHFALGVHGRMFDAIGKMIAAGSTANPVTLKQLFEHDEALAELGGGAQYLSNLAASVVTIINSADYARTIRDCWQRRQVMELAQEAIEAAAVDFEEGSGAILDKLETGLAKLHEIARGGSVRSLGEWGEDAIAAADRAYKHRGQLTGVPSGLVDLDRLTGGLQDSDLIYLAARPSMGKSALAGTIALNAALQGHPVYLSSPEMSGAQVALRALSMRTRLSSQRIRSGQI